MLPILSILIPTLVDRQPLFERITAKLRQQIETNDLSDAVELLSLCDNREMTLGEKRNRLLHQAQGEFVAFVDDDDDISDDYVKLICQAIQSHPTIDCVGITGQITFQGKRPRLFIHSLRYRDYFSRGGVYYRPPYHLNPIRRVIASQYPYEPVSYSEDIDWAMRLCHDQALHSEFFIDTVIYYYDSRRSWRTQQFIDLTEAIRHPLGLTLANRLRIKRWWRSIRPGYTNRP